MARHEGRIGSDLFACGFVVLCSYLVGSESRRESAPPNKRLHPVADGLVSDRG